MCPRVLLPWGHAFCKRWLRASCDHTLQMCMVQVPPIASPSRQLPSTLFDQRLGVLGMRKECDAEYSRVFGHVGEYSEPSPA